jgi:hypothetical protein
MKEAGTEEMKFMKLVVRRCLQSGQVMSKWKEARPILLHNKGVLDRIENWRLISITSAVQWAKIFEGRSIHGNQNSSLVAIPSKALTK